MHPQRRTTAAWGKSHVLWPLFGTSAPLPADCQADGAFPCGQSVCVAHPSSAGAWLEQPWPPWASAQNARKSTQKAQLHPIHHPPPPQMTQPALSGWFLGPIGTHKPGFSMDMSPLLLCLGLDRLVKSALCEISTYKADLCVLAVPAAVPPPKN